MGQRKMRICRIVTTLIAGVLPMLPQPAGAQKNIKVALVLSRAVHGIPIKNGMDEVCHAFLLNQVKHYSKVLFQSFSHTRARVGVSVGGGLIQKRHMSDETAP